MSQIRSFNRKNHARRGFSLLELAIVTVIIGILATASIPSFQRALEQSRADLAAANLRAVWSAQRLYWLDNRTYAASLATLESVGLLDTAVSSQPLYTLAITSAGGATFTAEAARTSNTRWNGTLGITQNGLTYGTLSGTGLADIVPSYQ